MSRSDSLDVLCNISLFSGCSSETLEKLNKADRHLYKSGDIIYSPECDQKKLVVLLCGQASVFSLDSQKKILLRKFERGGVMGIANLFSDSPFVSNIVAQKSCEALEISKEIFVDCLEKDKTLMHNYLSFLSGKICYLNQKILCLTAGSAERRLALYLDSVSTSDVFPLPVPLVSLSEMLDLGRASLYRAFDKLESDGFIKRDGKTVTLTNRSQMLEHYTL